LTKSLAYHTYYSTCKLIFVPTNAKKLYNKLYTLHFLTELVDALEKLDLIAIA